LKTVSWTVSVWGSCCN